MSEKQNWFSKNSHTAKSWKKGLAIFFFTLAAGTLTWAATANWPFSASSEVDFFDSERIEIAGGNLQLKRQYPWWIHTLKTDFTGTNSTFTDTEISENEISTNGSVVPSLSSGLTHYWKFDGALGAISNGSTTNLNDSKGSSHGTASNGGSGMSFVAGRFGNAVQLDGVNDSITMSSTSLGTTNTVSAWIKFSSFASGGPLLGTGGNPSWASFSAGSASSTDGGSNSPVFLNSFSTNTWYNVVIVQRSTEMDMYVDGVRVSTQPLASAWNFSFSNFGARGSAAYLAAAIDDVATWSRALSPAEVKTLAGGGVAVHMKPSASLPLHAPKLFAGMNGIVGYWPLDHTTGTVAVDMTSRTKSGTLTNFPGSPWAAGINGNGLAFASDDHIVLPNIMPVKGPITFSAWVKAGTFAGDNTIFGGSTFLVQIGTEVANEIQFSWNTSGTPVTKRTGAATLINGAWNHVAVTYDGSLNHSGVNIYHNGSLVTPGYSQNGSGTVSNPTGNWYIGQNGSGAERFNGTMDEVAIFDRVLSVGEIANLAGKKGETASYTSPVMDGEIATATWDKMTANYAKVTPGMQFVPSAAPTIGYGVPADMDGDGDTDFVVGNGGCCGQIKWDRNDGNGLFTAVAVGGKAQAIAVGDLTGDKALDIVNGDDVNGGVKWWKNDGAASPAFTEQTSNAISSDSNPLSVAIADIDNDGDNDVAACYGAATSKITWYQSDGASTPTFTAQTNIKSSYACGQILAKDMNADGFVDIVAISPSANTISWYKGNGGSSWTETTVSGSYTGASYIDVADIDYDGDIDIAATQAAGGGTSRVSWFVNDASATPTFATRNDLATNYGNGSSLAVADLDNDGDMDMVTNTSSGSTLDSWINNGSQTFTKTVLQTSSSVSTGTGTPRISIADINGDGSWDIRPAANSGNDVLFFNTPWKYVTTSLPSSTYNTVFAAADIDKDGYADLVVKGGSPSVYWHKGLGTGAFQADNLVQSSYDPGSVVPGDVNNDSNLDLIAAGPNEVVWWQGNGGASWGSKTQIDASFTNAKYTAVADIDGDGFLDVVAGAYLVDGTWYSQTKEVLAWWKGDGGGTWTKTSLASIASTYGASSLQIVDLDSDGKLDIVLWLQGGNYYWYKQSTTPGQFNAAVQVGPSSGNPIIADLDNDGLLDTVLTTFSCNGGQTWRRQTSAGTFASEQVLSTNCANLIYSSDLNGDGTLDIMRAKDMFLNIGTAASPIWNSAVLPGSALSASLAVDLNNDGLLDLVRYVQPVIGGSNTFDVNLQQSQSTAQLSARTDTTSSPTTTFVGPDDTASTHFAVRPLPGTSSGSGVLSNLDSKRYLQYQVRFFRNDTTLDPMLRNVRLDYTALPYSTLNPYATSAMGTPFSYASSFTVTGDNEPATSGIRYQLSGDGGNTWYYYNSGWVTSNGSYAQSSTEATINTNISTFDNAINMTANGLFKWKIIMSSDGNAQPTAGDLTVGYEFVTLTVAAPNGGERWGRNTSQLIELTSTGVIPNDGLTLEYNSTGSTTIFDQPITTGVYPLSHNEEKMTGAVAVYHFGSDIASAIANGSTTGLNDSKGSYNGTASNANATGLTFAAGKFEGAVNFDGVDDYITVSGTNTSQVMSVSVWINPTVTNNGMIYSTGNPGDFLRLQSGNVAGAGWGGQGQLNGVATISASTWTHLALVRTGTTGNWTVSLYINGVFDSSATSAIDPGTGSTVIGKRQSGGTGEYFNGKIDELAIFNRALRADEIAALAKTNPGYVWQVPDVVSTTMRVRARSVSAPAINDISNANFKTGIVWTNGGGNNLWSNAANWDAGVVPQAGDSVIFNNTSTANCTGDTINNNLGSIVLASGYTGTVTIKKNSVASGMSLTVVNDVTVNAGTLAVEADRDGTPVNGSGFTITAKDITIGASGNMNADAQGFAETQGPGYSASAGSSHGGVGASSNVKTTPAPSSYGTANSPTSIGSGGWASGGGAGGGAIKLNSTGTVTINGTLSANAAAGSAHRGTGSGGSIWITGGGTLAGTGTISANGGAYGGTGGRGGGGGRLDISGMSSVTFSGNLAVAGGDNTISYDGYAGTIVFPANYNLTLATDASGLKDFTLGYDGTYDYTFNNIVVKNGATLKLDANPTIINSKNGGASGNPYGSGTKITAASIDVQSGGKISADDMGFRAASNAVGGAAGNNGGSYGGAGSGSAPAAAYGSPFEPRALGSAVNNGDYNSSSGGGAVYLVVTGTTTVAGSISALGGSANVHSMSGSGGSIWINTGTLTGGGSISANGANGLGSGRAGGGGRVYITAGTSSGFSGTVTANKGTDANENNAVNGTVIIGKVWKGGTASWNTASNWTNNSLPTTGDSVIFTGVVSNASVTGDTIANNLANFIVSSDYTGTITINQNSIAGADTLTLTGDYLQYGGTVALNGDNDGNPVSGEGINITAANIFVDTAASLNANGKGFAAGAGPGHGGAGQGGTYGGVGGFNSLATYGSATNPTVLGSGGGSQDNAGGGAIGLTATGTVTINGTLSALGQGSAQAGGSTWEGGSGGSIKVTAATLTGTGSILANGGTVGTSGRGAGSGGRISLTGVTTNTFSGTLQAKGGNAANGTTRRGHTGTIAFPSGFNLTLGGAGNMSSLRLGSDGSYNQTFGTITINSGGTLEIDGNPQMNSGNGGAMSITSTGVTVASGGVLSADALGFGYTAGPGFNSTDGTGASYGGKGGLNSIEGYGYAVQPSYLGSSTDYYDGGGAVQLFVPSGTVSVAGRISADGGSNNDWESASGGSVYIVANTLSGGGIIRANAGNSPNSGRASGSGGRVYLALGTNSWSGNALTAAGAATGGTGNAGNGANGTVTVAALNITSPNGAEVWRVNSQHLISWTTGTTLPNDLILDYSLNDPTFTSPISINTGVAGNHHNEEKMSGALAVFHFDQGHPMLNPIPDATTNGLQDSKNTNHGAASNANGTGMAFTASGKFSSAVDFDGTDDYVNLGDKDSLIGNNFSYSFWVNPDVVSGSRPIITKQFAAGSGINIMQNATDLRIYDADQAGPCYTASGVFSAGTWAHFVVVYDSSNNALVYKNGSLVGGSTDGGCGNIPANNENFVFGKFSTAYFDGKMDEIAIFNRVLTLDEIAALASSNPGYVWTVPDVDDATVRLRVRSAADTVISDISTANFTLADINMVSPNGGEAWTVGSYQPIKWLADPSSPNDLTLEYSLLGTDFTGATSIKTALKSNTHNMDDAPNAVSVWHFDGTTGAIANNATAGLQDSKGVNEGTARNADGNTMAFVAGKYGNGVQLDGVDSYIDLGTMNGSSSIFGGNATFSFWINWTTVNGNKAIIRRNTGGGSDFQIGIDNSNRLYCDFNDVAPNPYNTTFTPTPGTWYHIACSYDQTQTCVYINGSKTCQAGTGAAFTTLSNSFAIGGYSGAGVNAIVDEFAVFNRALSDAEVSALAQSTNGTLLWQVPDVNDDTIRIRVKSAGDTSFNDMSDANFAITGGTNNTRTWDNGSGDGKWSNPVNWSSNNLPVQGNDVVFNNTSNTAVNADVVANNLASISLNSGYTNTVTFAKNAVNSGMALTLTGNLNVNSGNIAFTGDPAVDSIVGNDPYQGTDVMDGKGYTINAANVTVANGSKIHADGLGFPTAGGPGGATGAGLNEGASYGGLSTYGGKGVYGSMLQPLSLGSGGGAGAGGGAIKLNVTGTTTVNGTISANGETNYRSGSGGSIWIITNAFAGASTGLVQAEGGPGSGFGVGGGGRVKVTWTSSTYAGKYSSAGGIESGSIAKPGTLSIPWADITNLTVDKGFVLAPNGNYTFGNWTVTGANTILGILGNTQLTFGNFTVASSGAVIAYGDGTTDSFVGNDPITGTDIMDGTGITINATNFNLNSGTSFSGEGFAAATGPGAATPYGTNEGGTYAGFNSWGTRAKYGSLTRPTSLGSGGGMGKGGGAIKLNVSGTTTIDGNLNFSGEANYRTGSGGSVWLITDTLAGAGTGIIQTSGGDSIGFGAGGGGRISLDWSSGFTYAGSVVSNWGLDGSSILAQQGTIAYLEMQSPNGAEVWKSNKIHGIHWYGGRDVPGDLTLEYSTAGSDFSSPVSIATNVSAIDHNEEKLSGALGVWHFGNTITGSIANGATAGLTDSKNTNHGTASNVNGSGLSFTSGKFGGGLSFDGTDDSITVPNHSSLNVTTANRMTISAWINYNAFTGNATILSKGTAYNLRVDDNNRLALTINFVASATTSGVLTSGTWHHVAATWDGTTIRLYVNGVLSTSNDGPGTIGSNSTSLVIGALSGGSFWNGKLDEVALFDRTLSAEEIAILANTYPGYVWTTPALDLNTVRVRARSVSQPNLTDISNANFTITDLNVTAPNGAEIWRVGTGTHAITWSAGTNVPNDLTLEYTTAAADPTSTGTNPLTSWVAIDNTDSAPKNASPATHTWVAIPDAVSNTARVRIRSQSKADLVDVSNANFMIADTVITNPNGTNILYEGEKYQINWANGGTSLSDMILEVSTITGNWGAFSPAANNLSVRRADTSTTSEAGLNPATIANAVRVFRFNGGATTAFYDRVGLTSGTLTIGAGGNASVANAWVNGQFNKSVDFDGTDDYASFPSPGLPTGDYTYAAWVNVDTNNDEAIVMASDGAGINEFVMDVAGGFIRTIADGNTSLQGKIAIPTSTWTHLAVTRASGLVKMYVNGIQEESTASWPATLNFSTCELMIGTDVDSGCNGGLGNWADGRIDDVAVFSRALTPAEIRKLAGGSYEWTVPDVPSVTSKVRIRSASASDMIDPSDANFEIRARSVTVNAPNGGESYQEASRQTIQWTTAGLVSNNLTLDYNKGGGAYTTIATGVDAGGKPFERAVGAWGFGENGQTVTDKSGRGHDGTLGANSSAGIDEPVYVLGKLGQALSFDGVDDYVSIPDNSDYEASNITLSAWIYKTDSTAREVISKRQGASASFEFYTTATNGIGLSLFTTGGSCSAGATAQGGTISNNTWTHVAGTWDGTTIKVYVNGTQAATTACSATTIADSSAVLGIGKSSSAGVFFNGMIDEAQVYNRVISSAELTALASGKANYPWTVPNDEHAQVRVRVTDANRAASNDNSDADFAITPRTMAVNAPNGAETWPYNSIQYIKWDATGPLSNNLTIKYDADSTGGPAFPTTIATGVDAGGSPLSGSVGAWGLGEGSGTSLTDKSGNVNTATLNLGTLGNTITADAWKVGKLGYAIQFDGVDDYISLASNLAFGTSDFSVSAWIKTAVTSEQEFLSISTAGTQFRVTSSGKLGGKVANITANSTAGLTDNNWHHVVMTADRDGMMRLYIDGTADGSVDISAAAATDLTGIYRIGVEGTTLHLMNGMIDEMQVYNRVLTVGEVAVLAQGRGVYPWTVSDPGLTTNARSFANSQVQVFDANRTATTDNSDANFNVRSPIIGSITPPPPAAVPFGAPQDISWANDWTGTPVVASQGGPVSTDLRVEYSIDDGSTFPGGSQTIIGSSAANGGPVTSPYNWGVTSGAVSNTVKVRVRDNAFPFGEGISSSFKVTGSISVIKPNTAEKWAVGFPHTISWLRNGDITNVKIFTHNGNGTPITTIVSSTGASAGTYSWTPQLGDAGTGLYVRVQDAADTDVYDDSNVTFTVSKVQVGNPASRVLAGDPITTTWTSTGVTNVKLEYSTDGTNFSTVSGASSLPAGNLSHNWTIPVKSTTTFIVRAVDADVPGVGDTDLAFDASDSNAVIYGGLQVLTPSSTGITWAAGQPQNITWSTIPANVNVVPNVRILAAKDGNFNNNAVGNIVTIVSSAPNHNNPGAGTGLYVWTPNFTSTLVKIRVLDPADPAAVAGTVPGGQNVDDSNNFFTISGISLTSPAGGETALVNGSFGITFGFTGVVTNVDLHYSTNGGSTWTPIISNFNVPTNPYTYNWTPVPNAISTNVKVRVRDSANPSTVFAESLVFNIKGSINVTTPPTLYVGDPYTIQYTTTGSIPDTIIEFSPSGNFGGDEITIATPTGLSGAQTPTNQTFNWTVPNNIGTAGKIRVTADHLSDTGLYPNGSPATSGMSGAFSIGAKLSVTAPTGSDQWGVNDSNRIVTWTSVGTVSNVKIEYLDESDSYVAVKSIINSTSNDGSHAWNPIPDIVSNAGQDPQNDRDIMVKVRITDIDPSHPAVYVESAPFKVKWYRVLWKVKDADSGAFLQNLSVIDSQPWNVNDFTLTQTSGVFRNYKKGNYTTTWQKSSGYGDATIDNWVPDDANPDSGTGADMVRDAFLQNDATANVPKQVKVEYDYDVSTQTISFRWWIEIKGKLETAANLLTAGRIELINPDDNSILHTINDASEDVNGLYDGSWVEGGTLDTKKLYFAKAVVTHNSQEFTSGITVDIRDTAAIQNIGTDVSNILSDVAGVQTTANSIDNKIGDTADTSSSNSLFGKVASVKATTDLAKTAAEAAQAASESAESMVTTIEGNVNTILDEVANKLPEKIDQIDKEASNKGGRGQLLKRETKFAIGQTASIRFQHDLGKAPVVDVYGPDNKLIISGQVMTDPSGKGIYNYDFKLLSSYKKGDYTVIVTENESGFMDSMILTVLDGGSSDEDIANAITSASSFSQNASQDAKKAYDQMLKLSESMGGTEEGSMASKLGEIQTIMGQMKNSLFTLTGDSSSGDEIVTVAEVHDSVLQVMQEIKEMVSKKGINLDSVYKTVESQGETTTEIQNMVTAVQAISQTTQEMIEKAQDKPVMTTWFEG